MDEVLAPNIHRVHAQFAGDDVHATLDDVGRLRAARAAIGISRGGVRIDGVGVALHGQQLIAAAQHWSEQPGWHARRWASIQVRAHVGNRLDLDAQDGAIVFDGVLDILNVVAAMRRRHIILASLFGPFYRATQLFGGPHGQDIARIERNLAAKAAAHVAGNDAQPVFRDAGDQRAQQTGHMGVLAGVPEGHLFGARIPACHRGVCLHRVGDEALVDEVRLDDPVGGGESGVNIAIGKLPVEGEIARHVIVQQRRARFQRFGLIGDGGQWLVIDVNQVERVFGGIRVFGDDDGHAVAGIAHFINRQDAPLGDGHFLTVDHADFQRPGARQGTDASIGQILAGVDGHDAVQLLGLVGIDAANAGMAVRASQHGHVGLAGQGHILSVIALAGNQARVFAPFD